MSVGSAVGTPREGIDEGGAEGNKVGLIVGVT